MSFAPVNTSLRILGSFKEYDHGHYFEYAIRPDEGIDFAPDCPHLLFVGDQTRYAKILKGVAYVAVGEDASGEPIYEKWMIKQHRIYD